MKDAIVQEGAAVLRANATPVGASEFGSPALMKLIKKMATLLAKEEHGVAIAAPQVGVSKRLFVVAPKVFQQESGTSIENPPLVFINPEIVRLSKKTKEMSEGCLSVRGVYGVVLRHERATVRAQDATGTYFTYHGSGLLGHLFQHEVDHLDGILYIDKALSLRDDQPRRGAHDA